MDAVGEGGVKVDATVTAAEEGDFNIDKGGLYFHEGELGEGYFNMDAAGGGDFNIDEGDFNIDEGKEISTWKKGKGISTWRLQGMVKRSEVYSPYQLLFY